jgi:transposase
MNYDNLIREDLEKLKQIGKKQKLVRNEKRIQFLILLKSGQAATQKEAGRQVEWKLRQSQKIWRKYRESGIEGVLEKTERRGFGKLSSEQISSLNRYLHQFGASSLAEIQQYLKESFGVKYTIGGVSNLCLRLRVKLKTARPANYKQDAAQVQAYKKTSLA